MNSAIKKTLCFITIFFVAAKIALVLAIFVYPKFIAPEPETQSVSARILIELTNQYRQEQGVPELAVNPRLAQAAVNKAGDMFARQYFNHTSPEGKIFSDWIREVEYHYFTVGENLAIDFSDNETLFQAWLNSPEHRKNIIKPQYREIGIAALPGNFNGRPTIVVVQLFGTRLFSMNDIMPASPSASRVAPTDNFAGQPASELNVWQTIFSLPVLQKFNAWTNYLLIIFIGLVLISYAPQPRISEINIKQPIITRYHAKIFKE